MRPRSLALAALLSLSPATARAELDPEHAARDVEALRDGGLNGFCTAPRQPLPARAVALCAHAEELHGCEGFARACAALERKPLDLGWLRWIDRLFRAIGPFVQVLLWVLVALVLFALVRPLVLLWLRARGDRPGEAEPERATRAAVELVAAEEAMAERDAEALLSRAAEHEQRGELARAISTYLAASLRALDARGAVRLGRDKTNGDYVRACADADARAPLRAIVDDVDLTEYGGREPDRSTVSRVSARARALVRGVPVAVLLVTLALGGCGGAAELLHQRPGHDPSGDDLLIALLEKQGVKVGHTGPLGSLPLATGDADAAAVMVDLTRTPVEEDALRHLVAFARSGGVLVLVGAPDAWPKLLDARSEPTLSETIEVTPPEGRDAPYVAKLTHRDAFTWAKGVAFARTDDGRTFAAVREVGDGRILGIAGSELFTNVGIARKGNAAAALAILDLVDRTELRIARPQDGTSAASNPLSALVAAGLGLGLVHAGFAILSLFLARGSRLTRPVPRPSPRRRAFVEHVEATGALWARTRLAPHALKVFGAWVEHRLRAEGVTIDEQTQALLDRARDARTDELPRGDELATIKRLAALPWTRDARHAELGTSEERR